MPKKSLTNDDYVKISNAYYDESDNSRQLIRDRWDAIQDLANNRYDFSQKADWQSQSWIPKISNSIRTATAIMKRALIRSGQFFTLNTNIRQYKNLTVPLEKLIYNWLEELKFNQSFIDSLQMALICNLMIFKVFYRQKKNIIDNSILPTKHDNAVEVINADTPKNKMEALMRTYFPEAYDDKKKKKDEFITIPVKAKDNEYGELRIVPINPYFFGIDPTGRNKYVYHVTFYDIGDFVDRAKDMGYSTEFIDSIKEEDFRLIDDEYREYTRMGQVSIPSSSRKQVMLIEYWGDIIDCDGNIIKRNCTWTVANKKYLVRGPIDNFFIHGKYPFVWGPVVRKPFSVWHKSFLEDNYKLAQSITDLFNVIMDANTIGMAKAFELDLDIIEDAEQFKSGIYPGKTYFKRAGGNPNTRMIQEITLGQLDVNSSRVYQLLDLEYQNGTGLTEFVSGTKGRGRPTATEVVEKGAQALSIMEDLALDVEDNVLCPLLEMVLSVLLQYQQDFDDPRLEMLTEEMRIQLRSMAYMSKDQKKLVAGLFKFKVRGLSSVVARGQELNKVLGFLKVMANIPGGLDRINMKEMLTKIVDSMNWDPSEVLISDEEYQNLIKIRMLSAMQQYQMQQQQAANNVAGEQELPPNTPQVPRRKITTPNMQGMSKPKNTLGATLGPRFV